MQLPAVDGLAFADMAHVPRQERELISPRTGEAPAVANDNPVSTLSLVISLVPGYLFRCGPESRDEITITTHHPAGQSRNSAALSLPKNRDEDDK